MTGAASLRPARRRAPLAGGAPGPVARLARLGRQVASAGPLVLPTLFLGSLLLSTVARAEDMESDAVYVPAADARSLTIRNPLGTVKVAGWDRPQVRIIAHKRANSASLLGRLRVRVDFGEGRVRVVTGFYLSDDTFNALPLAGAGIDLVIEAPRQVALAVTTFEGDVDAAGFRAGARLSSQRGHLRVADVFGPVETRALDGNQWLEDIQGSLAASGVQGDLDLVDVRGPAVEASVFYGRITARNVEAPLVRLHTTAGTVIFIGPLRAGGRYDLATREGDVRLLLREAPFTVTARASKVRSALSLEPVPGEGGWRHVALAPPTDVDVAPARLDLVSGSGVVELSPLR